MCTTASRKGLAWSIGAHDSDLRVVHDISSSKYKERRNATPSHDLDCTANLHGIACLSGCGPSGNAAKIIGSWKLDAGPATVTVTYSKDHTYVATMAGLANGSETGEWNVNGDRLIQKAKSSTIDAENVGKEEPSTICEAG